MPPAVFTLGLHHLSADATQAGPNLPDLELANITPDRLRVMLEALTALASRIQYPASPEIRIASGDRRFLVQIKDGHVRFTSWSLRTGGNDLTPQQILAPITGSDDRAGGATGAAGTGGRAGSSRGLTIALIAVAILGSNAITAWMLTRPPPDLMPEYRLLAEEPGKRLLADVAGDYATGAEDGDYALHIAPDGAVRWVTFGEKGAVAEETRLTAQAAESRGKPALVTSNRGLIEIRDPVTVVFYRDAYQRRGR